MEIERRRRGVTHDYAGAGEELPGEERLVTARPHAHIHPRTHVHAFLMISLYGDFLGYRQTPGDVWTRTVIAETRDVRRKFSLTKHN